VYTENGVKVDLRNGQKLKAVTAENVELYIARRALHHFTAVLPQLKAFAAGVAQVIPKVALKTGGIFLSVAEVSDYISGSGIDAAALKAWKEFTKYDGYTRASKPVQHFWKIVDGMSAADRSRVLRFFTSHSRVPPGGFKDMYRWPTIRKPQAAQGLPTAVTCDRTLVLPPYESLAVMRERLSLAIANLEFEEGARAQQDDGYVPPFALGDLPMDGFPAFALHDFF
jgi:hypothetical protein